MTNLQTIAILDDGWTYSTRVYHRGQHLTDVDIDLPENAHFKLTPDEQIERYGRVFYRIGVWEGALYDTGDPHLTPEEKARLEEANKEIIALRKSKEKVRDTDITPVEDTTRRGRPVKTS